jgi:hypothetical protein
VLSRGEGPQSRGSSISLSPSSRPRVRFSNVRTQVSELETLVESKIFREGELTDEVARYRRLLAQAEQKGFVAESPPKTKRRGTATKLTRRASGDGDVVCELCGDAHGIENCPLFGETSDGSNGHDAAANGSGELFCEDCEVCSFPSLCFERLWTPDTSPLVTRRIDVLSPTRFSDRAAISKYLVPLQRLILVLSSPALLVICLLHVAMATFASSSPFLPPPPHHPRPPSFLFLIPLAPPWPRSFFCRVPAVFLFLVVLGLAYITF